MPTEGPTVVCAERDGDERTGTAAALSESGLGVVECRSVAAFEDVLDASIDGVVTGRTFDDGDAFDVLAAVRDRFPDCPVVIFDDDRPSEVPPSSQGLVVEYLPSGVPDAHDRLVSRVADLVQRPSQVAYPVPEDEQARIEAIRRYDLADLDAADSFDRLTKLVASHFDIDVAFVGLVDEHEERFVACEGANWETLARENSICTYTILQDEVTVVEDVRQDPRFAANDRLEELGIRSYAGVRLTTPDGRALGALCCTNDEPRSYSRAERADLRLFAEEAMEQLELRRRLNERRESLE